MTPTTQHAIARTTPHGARIAECGAYLPRTIKPDGEFLPCCRVCVAALEARNEDGCERSAAKREAS